MHNQDTTLSSLSLSILAVIFKLFGILSVSAMLNLFLTCLSIVSVLMLIVINWPKFINALKKKE